jgi:DNA processing protein
MDKIYYLGFSVFSGIGPIKFKALLNQFGLAKDAWNAPEKDLKEILGEKLLPKFLDFRDKFSLRNYEKELKEKKVWYLTLDDKNYPNLLKQITNPPIVLYGKGRVLDDTWFLQSIAVVGARKTTQYGREVTKIITEGLVQNGVTIVSGLALGVDAVAAMTTIESGGKTIAVLGSGVDVCHPSTNTHIYNSIVKNFGAVVSEVPLGQSPGKGLFPARNRIIAGLSFGVIVTEGAEDSGSLITADYAFKFNRKVFAVPGPITSQMSKGPYKLIEKGAKLVTSAQDVISNFQFSISNQYPNLKSQKNKTVNFQNLSKDEQEIIDLLQNETLHFDQIARRIEKSPKETGAILGMMEIKGLIKNSGGFYSLN